MFIKKVPFFPVLNYVLLVKFLLLSLKLLVYLPLNLQTPTQKQSRYKEQVVELRKGRNSGLQKEQKEKHMVHQHPITCCYPLAVSQRKHPCSIMFLVCCFTSCLSSRLVLRSIDSHTVTPESLCLRTSQVTMTWSCSGKPRPVHLKIW